LLGKNKPTYSPDKLSNNFVIITNASEIHVTGSKLDNKEIYSHSGFIGGLKRETLGNAIKSNPSKVLRKSVKGMLPKNKLSEKLIHRLKIYAGAKHPHSSQLSNRSSNDN
jgi:large subunit ribosomal protein L13